MCGISFRANPGSLVCILGGNGSGKSTLLHVLAGLLKPEGQVSVLGYRLPEEVDRLRPDLAYLPQEPDAYILGSTVLEDLCLGLAPGVEEARSRALELAGRFGIASLLDRPVQQLSHGEKRKLCLASALTARPRLLLMDEPESGLDYSGILELRRIIKDNKAAGLSQVLVLHDLDVLGDLPDLFLVLESGRLVGQGSAAEVFPVLAASGLKPPCWWLYGKKPPLD